MTKLNEQQEKGLVELRALTKQEKFLKEEISSRIHKAVEEETQGIREQIAKQAYLLYKSGVPARRIGKEGLETSDYKSYMSLIGTGKHAVTFAIFSYPAPDTMIISLSNWEGIAGEATFKLVEGEWLNNDYESEVGRYAEHELFEADGRNALKDKFESSLLGTP